MVGGDENDWWRIQYVVVDLLRGTFWDVRLLRKIPEQMFRELLYGLILARGMYMAA